jgi:hypothetical protein
MTVDELDQDHMHFADLVPSCCFVQVITINHRTQDQEELQSMSAAGMVHRGPSIGGSWQLSQISALHICTSLSCCAKGSVPMSTAVLLMGL